MVGIYRTGDAVDSELVVLTELSDGAGLVGAASGTVEDATLADDADVSGASSLVVEVAICTGVDVEDTNGGAFSMYDPDGWTA